MLLAKILLVIQGAMSIVYALLIFLDPSAQAATMGLVVASGDGAAELLTMYVGMSCAVSAFMLYAVFNTRLIYEAILFLAIFMTGIAVGRIAGFLLFDTGAYIVSALVYDIPVAVLSWAALRQVRVGRISPQLSS